MVAGRLSGFGAQHEVATFVARCDRHCCPPPCISITFCGMCIVFIGRSDALWWTGRIEIKMACINVCVCVCMCIVTYLYGQFVSSCANLFTRSLQEPHLGVNRGGTAVLSAPVTHVDDRATTIGVSIFRVFHDYLYRCFPNVLAWGNPLTSTNNHGSSHPCSRQYRVNRRQVIRRYISHLRTDFR